MIYVDVSHLVWNLAKRKHCGGIHRVTLRSALGLSSVLNPEHVSLIAYSRGQFWQAPVALLAELESFGANGTDASGLPQRGNFRWDRVACTKGDSVLLTEWFQDQVIVESFADLRLKSGVRIYQFIHDMLPLAMPDYFFRHVVRQFRRGVSKALEAADVVLTNSNYSAADIKKFGKPSLRDEVPVRVVRLPHEIGAAAAQGRLPSVVCPPFVLMVGTLEGRKNTPQVIAAWRKLRRRHAENMPQLVLVGNFSWIGMTRLRLMVGLALEGRRKDGIAHLQGCDDGQLQALYRNCLFSIYVSQYEGWGLPIGESLWLGRPVLAGTSTSLPEVGGNLVEYVDPANQSQLEAKIEKLCFDHTFRDELVSRTAAAKLRDWNDFSSELAAALDVRQRARVEAD